MNHPISNHINTLLEACTSFGKTQNKVSEMDLGYDFSNDVIVITGAAGTIGSGLTRLLLGCKFKTLILIDNAETPLYYLQKELETIPQEQVHVVLADIRDNTCMEDLFKTFVPTCLFHTAAYKHVSMMESNPYEAVKLNIWATQSLADLALRYNLDKFIFISTDKAVNAISVMGMSKRICERYLEHLNLNGITKFLVARFGNILESNGSLIPLFTKQIEQGIPLTVTHKDVSRYFITKVTACKLILKMAILQNYEHHVFTFNMGNPVNILELAHGFLKKNHLSIHGNINIIGLRSGEKLHEEIIYQQEELKPTTDQDMFYVVNKDKTAPTVLDFKPIAAITPYDTVSSIKKVLKSYLT
ncbi:polysaccharide biosynthesis protein [Yeosuana sp. AK3]